MAKAAPPEGVGFRKVGIEGPVTRDPSVRIEEIRRSFDFDSKKIKRGS
jgi:hypothetical protein